MTGGDLCKILVADDDEASRYLKAHILRRRGYRVFEAASGAEALGLVERERPPLVLLDAKLPDERATGICREIKARQPGTLVLLTSAAFTATRDRAAGSEGRPDSYLAERIEPEELLAQVASLLRLNRVERELRLLNEELERRVAERTRELIEANRRLAAESAQRAKAEETLRHAEKLDAIGQLTGGVAHDFNNLLTVVLGNLKMIDQELGAAAPQFARIGRLAAAARRATEGCEHLTRQLLAFSRRDVLRPEVIDPNEAIGAFENLLKRALGEHIGLSLALAADPWACCVDRAQFEAALLNLAVNARDAMPLGGAVRLSTRNAAVASPADVASSLAPLPADAKPGDYLCVSLADSGTGMSKDVLAHAFEPFFTTKDIGRGSGLGLSQVYGFVRQSGGFIAVETELQAGTTFHTFLPRAAVPDGAASLADDGNTDEAPRGTETILIVEDNEMVLEFAVATIAQLGYRVLLAGDATAALDILATGEAIDLLFTDIVLPNRMSGVDLAREARRLRPALKVLTTSGYPGRAQTAGWAQKEFPLLSKPYGRRELANRIREVLAEEVAVP